MRRINLLIEFSITYNPSVLIYVTLFFLVNPEKNDIFLHVGFNFKLPILLFGLFWTTNFRILSFILKTSCCGTGRVLCLVLIFPLLINNTHISYGGINGKPGALNSCYVCAVWVRTGPQGPVVCRLTLHFCKRLWPLDHRTT